MTAKEHLLNVLYSVGLPPQIMSGLYNSINEEEAVNALEFLAMVQKDETFSGTSDKALAESAALFSDLYPDEPNIKKLSDVLNDFYNKDLSILEDRYKNGFYDMTDLEKYEYYKFERDYNLYRRFEGWYDDYVNFTEE